MHNSEYVPSPGPAAGPIYIHITVAGATVGRVGGWPKMRALWARLRNCL